MLQDKHTIQEILLWAGAVAVIAAALVTAIVQLFNGWRERVATSTRHLKDIAAADARHMRELALEAAIAEWKQNIEDCKNWQPDRQAGQREEHRPIPEFFDLALIKKLKMIQTFGDGSLTVEQMLPKWREMGEFHKFLRDAIGKDQTDKNPTQPAA